MQHNQKIDRQFSAISLKDQNNKLQYSSSRQQSEPYGQLLPNVSPFSEIKKRDILTLACCLGSILCLSLIIIAVVLIQDKNMGYKQQIIETPIYEYSPEHKYYNSSIKDGTTIEEMQKMFPRLIVDSFNRGKNGTIFGEDFKIKIQQEVKDQTNIIFNYDMHGLAHNVQAGTQFDYLNIKDKVNFTQLQTQLLKSISYQLIQFKKDQTLEKPMQKIAPIFLTPIRQFELGRKLSISPNDPQIHRTQYAFYHQKYKIGHKTSQIPICIIAVGYKIFSKNRYRLFFDSMERQNYTNFHIVYIDDNSPDQTAYKVFDYLNHTNSRLTNRIKIVHNLQHLGAMANFLFWIKNYCGDQDIVVIADGDDSLIGRQALNVLNAIYQNPNRWYVYTSYIQYRNGKLVPGQASLPFQSTTDQYRHTLDYWVTSHLRTWRKQPLYSVPFQCYIQYHYNKTEKTAYPHFIDYSSDRTQIYPLLQLGGTDRLYHTTDFLLLYDASVGAGQSSCYRNHERYDEYKIRIKPRLTRIKNFGQKGKYSENTTVPTKILTVLAEEYAKYKKCLEDQAKQ